MIPGKECRDRARVAVRQPTRPEQARIQNMASMFVPQRRGLEKYKDKKKKKKSPELDKQTFRSASWVKQVPVVLSRASHSSQSQWSVEGEPGSELSKDVPEGWIPQTVR